MKTKHCPNCDSRNLSYVINIFKKRTDKNYYTGEVQCDECKTSFIKKDIKEKRFIEKSKVNEVINKYFKRKENKNQETYKKANKIFPESLNESKIHYNLTNQLINIFKKEIEQKIKEVGNEN